MARSLVSAGLVACALASVAPESHGASVGTRYFLTDLSGGSTNAQSALSINDRGQVLINETPNVSGQGFTSLWTPTQPGRVDGTRVVIPSPVEPITNSRGEIIGSRSPASFGWSLNNFGQIAGTFDNYASAFVWTPSAANESSGTFTTIKPAGATLVEGYAVNSRGDAVIYTAGAGQLLYSATSPNSGSGTLHSLTPPASSPPGNALCINDRGDIGFRNVATDGVLFRPSVPNGTTGTYINIPSVRGLNNTGLVATDSGLYRVDANPSPNRTLLAAGAFRAVNDEGLAISMTAAWSASDGLVPLESRLEPHSASGWTLNRLNDINAGGQIAGIGSYDADGNPSTPSVPRAVLLTPLIDGDATIDGHVDFADLVVLAQHYNEVSGQTWREADFDGNGNVNFEDLVLLAQNYDEPAMSFQADWAAAQALVPEPGICAVTMMMLAAARSRRR